MTIASSGQLVFPTELNTELRRTGALTMPDASTRWLADRPTGALTFPTHFHGKSGFKLVDSVTSFSTIDTSHSFAGVSFGPFYTGRRILAVIELRNKAAATTGPNWDLSSVSIGGTSASDSSPYYYQDGGSSTFLIGLGFISIGDSMTATSGTISFTSNRQTNARPIAVLSVANIGAATDTGTAYGAATDPLTVSGGVDTGSNGFIIAASLAFRAGGLTNATFSSGGWSELIDLVSNTSYYINVSAKNRQTSGTKTVSCSWSGGIPTQAIVSSAAV